MSEANLREAFETAIEQITDNERRAARATLEGILSEDPAHVEARLALGILLGGEGEKGDARRHLRVAMEQIAINPRIGSESLRAQALIHLCALSLEEDDWEDVVAWEDVFGEMKDALHRQGLLERAASILFDAGNAATKERAPVQAKKLYERAAHLEPDFGEVWYNLAVIASEDGEFADARDSLEKAIASDRDFADAHFLLGTLLLQEEPEKATRHMEAAIARSPENAQWITLTGSAFARRRKFERARELFARSLTLDEQQADAHLGLAIASRGLGEIASARDSLKRAFELNPKLAQQIQGMMSRDDE